jgi:Tol biopolymer transport system component
MSITPRAVTSGSPHFFGYYDKCPWSPDGRRLLACRAPFQDRLPEVSDPLVLGVIDLSTGRFQEFAQTTAWSWQQGAMLQWLDNDTVIYNARDARQRPIGIIHALGTDRRRELQRPIYTVSPRGDIALGFDFHRMHAIRAGYGYPPSTPITPDRYAPDDTGFWLIDLQSGEAKLILSVRQVQQIRPAPRSLASQNWIDHPTFNTDGSRVVFLHRYTDPQGPAGPWITRLFTMAPDGSRIHLLSDHGMCSHFTWRDPAHLLAWSSRPGGDARGRWAYHLYTDLSDERTSLGEGTLDRDGHMTYSPDGKWLLTDEYPGADKAQPLLLYHIPSNTRIELNRFAAPFSGENRCDLHPRWDRTGRQVCFDSAHTGTRQVYVMDVAEALGSRV